MNAIFAKPENHTPSDVLELFENERMKRVCYESAASGGHIPQVTGKELLTWVQNAWNEFWKSAGIMPDPSASDAHQVGYMLGMMQGMIPIWEPCRTPASTDAVNVCDSLMAVAPGIREQAAQLPAAEAAAFFAAQRKGFEQSARIEQLSQRTKILMVMAALWELIAQFKSTGELFQWLRSLKGEGGTFLAPATDSRDIRKICSAIGLRFESKGGRPPKKTRP